jgi:ABC-type multidrug transport system fused ATPase/permease subunit
MTKTEGDIVMQKDGTKLYPDGLYQTISYASQTPWLQHQSIKDNILFGSAYDAARYADVLDACALRPDLKILEDGDETEIGARGVSLSGGQKARVALARATYARTKFVLLDDPLSAVVCYRSELYYLAVPLMNLTG